MLTYAVIFARGGSKGLPNKNILNFCGHPLITWTIKQALAVDRIDKVIVSTDSVEIARVAKEAGAYVPFIRPSELATDDSAEWLSWKHLVKFLKNQNQLPEILISLPATSPLRSLEDINNCLKEFHLGDCDGVLGITESHRNPYFNMVSIDSQQRISILNQNAGLITRRQDAPNIFDITTIAYVARPSYVESSQGFFVGNIRGVLIPKERALDIDDHHDFLIAEYLQSLRNK